MCEEIHMMGWGTPMLEVSLALLDSSKMFDFVH